MPYVANTDQIREADRIMIEDIGYPGILLMETAGRKSAECILEFYPAQTSFWILAGPGNNGGDGLVIARYLHLAGKEVRIMYSQDPARYLGDAAINQEVVRHLPIASAVFEVEEATVWLSACKEPPVLIDALLGTGITSTLRGTIAEMVSFFRKSGLPVLAIDLPSGLSADSGKTINQVLSAEHTLTFQLAKLCHYITPASLQCGTVHVIDIGIWPSAVEQLGISRYAPDSASFSLQPLPTDAHKGKQGHVLLIGGSMDMSGAIAMTAIAAASAGVGLCTVLAPRACRDAIFSLVPEVMCKDTGSDQGCLDIQAISHFPDLLEGKTAIVIGPGMGQHPETASFLKGILPHIQVPLLLDADALNLIAAEPTLWNDLPARTVLTPHPGEMRRLAPDADLEDRLMATEELAQRKGHIVVLKGAGTITSSPDQLSWINTSGNPGMATGGSGDILSGIIGALLAQGYPPFEAAAMGVYLHGKAGDYAADLLDPSSMRATDIARNIAPAFRELRNQT